MLNYDARLVRCRCQDAVVRSGQSDFHRKLDGGSEPVWAKNGKELFYRADKKLISLPVKLGADFVPGPPRVLFQGDFAKGGQVPAYDVSSDGQRFYFVQQDPKTQELARINLIVNWSEEVKRLAPVGKKR